MLVSNITSAQNNPWEKISTPVDERLNDVFFLDSLRGWVTGDSGVILYTSTGGNNWTIQASGITDEIFDVFFLNENDGWALAWKLFSSGGNFGTRILKTSNGGLNWTNEMYPVDDVFLNTITFYDSLTGWMGGYPGIMVYTTDGGDKWIDAHVDSSFTAGFPVIRYSFFDSEYGFACGGIVDIAGVIWKTENGGQNWTSEAVGPEPIQAMHFFDSLNIIGVGGDFEYGSGIVTSDDGGRTWDYRSLNVFGIASAVSFRKPQEGWAPLGFAQVMIYTTDGGENWSNMNTPDSSVIYDLQFTDSTHGFACGEEGTVLKYYPIEVGINNGVTQIPLNHTLFQNYPNPFNPATTISYELVKNGHVTLKIYDINGRELKSFAHGFKTTGTHMINFNADGMTSGVYYYKLFISPLNGGDIISETKKMVLLK